MRPVVKSKKVGRDNLPLKYPTYTEAKPDLISELGDYCSYCEKKVNRSSLHVEHIYPKGLQDNSGELLYKDIENQWDNFLLACSNCNSIKGLEDTALINPYLPHINNLVHFIELKEGGSIRIKRDVGGVDLIRTKAFIGLVGLDRVPGHPSYSKSDDRWEYRLEAKEKADRLWNKYISTPRQTDIENIAALAREVGFFSVWYYRFLDHPEVLQALIDGIMLPTEREVVFQGTDTNSFQPTNYTTLPRP